MPASSHIVVNSRSRIASRSPACRSRAAHRARSGACARAMLAASASAIGLALRRTRAQRLRHRFAGDAAEHRRIRDTVAAETVRAVHAARILARDEQPFALGRAIGGELDAAHHVVRGRHDFDLAGGEIEAAIGAALDHSLELAAHVVGTQMRHAEPHAAVRRRAARAHLGEDRARDDVARRALVARIVAVHEALAGCRPADSRPRRASPSSSTVPVIRVCAPASNPVGWNCTISMSRSGSPARSAIARPSQLLSPDGVWNRYIVGPPPVASSTAFACTNSGSPVRTSIISTPASAAVARGDEVERAMLLEPPDAARPHLLGEPADDLDAGQVALVHGAIERLAGERLLVDRAVGIAIEKAAELVLELVDALDGAADERPREILVRQPLAALDRVHEVALDRIARRERDVVAALDHPRAAALAEQSLDGDRDVERRVDVVRVQRGEQSRAAGAEDQDVGASAARCPSTPRRSIAPSAAARRSRAALVDGVVEARRHGCPSRPAAARNRARGTARGSRD